MSSIINSEYKIKEKEENIPLFRKFPKLKSIAYLKLANFPTPVQKMEELSKTLSPFEIYIKRDDLCSTDYGGNKPRKYEFVLADAKRKNKKNILTTGGIGSNHTLANTIFAKKMGMESYIYLFDQPLTEHVRQNLLADYHFGAQMYYTKNYVKTALKMIGRIMIDRKAYIIMAGASTPLGTIGFVNAGLELAEQVKNGELPPPDKLFVAVGSTGTSAGLLLGIVLGNLPTIVYGIGVTEPIISRKKNVIKLAKKTLKLMRKYDPDIPRIENELKKRLVVTHDYFGGEYGRATIEGIEAIEMAAKDGIKLDVTYTGKAMSGLIDYCRKNKSTLEKETLIFWNTLNSHDLTSEISKTDYHELPKEFHKFFDGTLLLDEEPVSCFSSK